jgi:hypothetical protein
MVLDLSTLLKELFEHMDDDIQSLPQVQQTKEIAERLIEVYGQTLSAPDNRQ